MAFLNETEQWESGVYQLETTDPVQGGPGGIDNRPHTALANRTLWLKTKVESLAAQIVAGVDAATLQGKSVAQIEADIIAAISDGASSAYDTLIEIQNAIKDNDLDIASLLSTLSTKADRGGDPTQRFRVAAAQNDDESVNLHQINEAKKTEIIYDGGKTANAGTLQTSKPMTDYSFIIVLYDLGDNRWNYTEIVPKITIQNSWNFKFLNIDNGVLSDGSGHDNANYFQFKDDKTQFDFSLGDRWTDDNGIIQVIGVKI